MTNSPTGNTLKTAARPAGAPAYHDEASRHLAQMVREYDPTISFVLVIRDPDDYSIHSYCVNPRRLHLS